MMLRNPGLVMLTALAIALLAAVALMVDMASAQTATPTSTPTPTATANPIGIVDQNLIACYKLDEAQAITHPSTGSTVRFDSWRANHLTDNNSVDGAGTGIINGAASFVGANNESLSRPDNADISFSGNTDGFTFSWWMRPDSLAAAQYLISKQAVTAAGSEYFVSLETTGAMSFGVYISDGTLYQIQNAATGITIGNIYFVAVRFDPGNADGTRRYMINVNGTWYQRSSASAAAIYDGTNTLFIGMRGAGTNSSGSAYTGWIDNLIIHDRALSDTEIAHLYNSGYGRGCTELIGARGTPTATATVAATATPNPGLALSLIHI